MKKEKNSIYLSTYPFILTNNYNSQQKNKNMGNIVPYSNLRIKFQFSIFYVMKE